MKSKTVDAARTSLPLKHFAMTVVSEFAPNDSAALSDFSTLLSSHTEAPSGNLNGVPVWQAELTDSDQHEDEESRIYLRNGWISYVDRLREKILRIKCDDAQKALPDIGKADLTQSEMRLAILLTAGMTLQEAASSDGTSYQTKRSQLKSIFAKTGHGKQHTLVASVGGELASFFERYHLTRSETKFQWQNYARFLPTKVRVGTLYGQNSAMVPYLDFGPPDGEVTFLLHPFIFPKINSEDVDFAIELNRRFILPVRPGTLGRPCKEDESWPAFVDDCIRELAICFDTFANKPAEIVALVSSGAIATRFAQFFPKKVSAISYLATCYPPGFSGSGVGEFWASIVKLLSKDYSLGHSTLQFVGSLASQTDRFKRGILGTYNKNPLDERLIQAEMRDEQGLARLKFATLESYKSIAQDFAGMAHFNWKDLSQLICKTRFIHGADDKIHDLDEIRLLARETSGKDPIFVSGAAQWTEGAPLRALLKAAIGAHEA